MKGRQLESRRGFDVMLMCALALIAGAASVPAVLFKSTSDPAYNTNAPTGSLTNSGWRCEGTWANYLATAIAPTYFIAADHVGGSVGDPFTLNGFTYHTVATFKDPDTDLRIWKVAPTFPIYAPLYTNSNEVGKHCIAFGRGTQRGDPVIVSGQTNGWKKGTEDHVERWGENDIVGIGDGGAGVGQLLAATFDRNAGSNECHLTVGDSSGGLFIQDSGVWRLAGVHRAVDGPFSNAVDGTVFDAALMDRGGLYQQSGTNWVFFPDTGQDNPSHFFSTRISAELAWINSVIDFLPGDDLRITGIQVMGNDVSISFATTNRLYYVQRIDDLGSGTWTTFTNNVLGTGGIVSILDTNAATLPQRFYRVGLVP